MVREALALFREGQKGGAILSGSTGAFSACPNACVRSYRLFLHNIWSLMNNIMGYFVMHASKQMTINRYQNAISLRAVLATLAISLPISVNATDYANQIQGTVPATILQNGDTVEITGTRSAALEASGVENGVQRSVMVENGGITVANRVLSATATVQAWNGGLINLGTGSTVIADGYERVANEFGATGIYARSTSDGFAATVIARDLTIDASSSYSVYGTLAQDGGIVRLTGDTDITINAYGNGGAVGMVSWIGTTEAENVNITMAGPNGPSNTWANGVYIQTSGNMNVTGHSTIDIQALNGSIGRVIGANTSLVMNSIDGRITTSTGRGFAIVADGGVIDITGHAALTATSADSAVGISARNGANVRMTGSSVIDAAAPATWAIIAETGANVALVSSNISAIGSNGGVAIYLNGTTGGATTTVSLDKSTITSSHYGVFAAAGVNRVAFTNTTMNNGALPSVSAAGAGTVLTFDMHASTITGSASTSAQATSNIAMRSNSLWTVTADSVVSSLTNDNSRIAFASVANNFQDSAAYKTLQVGNYTGANGRIDINAHLGADGSPTDLVHVSGDTAGDTSVRVTNTGGTGAPTIEGIRIIQVDGASAGTFSLLSDYTYFGQPAVIAGAYSYTLHKNGVSTPADGDWYLRSSLSPLPPVDPEPPVDPQPPVNPQPPVDPQPPAEPTPPPAPMYQPGAPLYETMPRVAFGLIGLSTLQQRIGNRLGQDGAVAQSEAGQSGLWGSLDGQLSNLNSGFSATSATIDQRQWRAETGFDFRAASSVRGALVGGVNVHYGQAFADISSPSGRGQNQTTAVGIGGNVTWYGENGFYADAQGRVAWLETDLTSHTLDRDMGDSVKGFGSAISLETGQRLRLGQHLRLIPQAQLIWTSVGYDSFIDPYGATVSRGDGESLQGRLGLALEHERQWEGAAGNFKDTSFYGIANLYHEALNGTSVNVSGARLRNEEGRIWAGVGLGGSYNLNGDTFSLYGEIQTATNISGQGDSYRLGGKLGIRGRW